MSAESSADLAVRVRGLHFAQGHGRKVIFDGVDLDIPRGKVTAILGPSGTGKTTLLRLIGGMWRPDAGSIEVNGRNVPDLGRRELMALRKKMGLLWQNGALLTDFSVFENVAFPLREHTDLPESMLRDIVLMKLHAVGLRGAAQLWPEQLSGGMARRVALARAIALDPDMILYDEPFAGQDPISMGMLLRLIRRLNDTLGLTSVVVAHDVAEVMSIADQIYVISRGKVIVSGDADTVRECDSDWVQQFIHGRPDGPVPFHQPAPDYAEQLLGDGHD